MNGRLSQKWFDSFVVHVRKFTNDPVVLLWDNFTGHLKVESKDKSIRIIALPANVTARYQPLDQGIIRAFKSKYKAEYCRRVCNTLENWDSARESARLLPNGCRGVAEGCSPHMLDVLEIAKAAWDGVTRETIMNCWVKSTALPMSVQTELLSSSAKHTKRIQLGLEAFPDDNEDVIAVTRLMKDVHLYTSSVVARYSATPVQRRPVLLRDNLLAFTDADGRALSPDMTASAEAITYYLQNEDSTKAHEELDAAEFIEEYRVESCASLSVSAPAAALAPEPDSDNDVEMAEVDDAAQVESESDDTVACDGRAAAIGMLRWAKHLGQETLAIQIAQIRATLLDIEFRKKHAPVPLPAAIQKPVVASSRSQTLEACFR